MLSPAAIDKLIRDKNARIHYAGIAGNGMSAYALHRALEGGSVSGSDRAFDQGHQLDQKAMFKKHGARIFAQDGSGVPGAAAVVASVAVEAQVPDIGHALELNIPVIPRRDWLAALYRTKQCIAITGTSGKSTTTAMVFEILKEAGYDPGLITGADLFSRVTIGLPGNAAAGQGPLVIEADESDKGISGYAPQIGVILNLQRDHDEPENMMPALRAFKENCCDACIISADPALTPLHNGALMAPLATDIVLNKNDSSFGWQSHAFTLPIPGAHNVANAALALAVAAHLKIDMTVAARALAGYKGIARRFNIYPARDGIEVIDDYAHNPDKLAALLATAQTRASRVILYFQPTGFGPTRFLKDDLIRVLTDGQRKDDRVYLAPIPYMGGTVVRDIASDDLVSGVRAQGKHAQVIETRADFIEIMKKEARAGDCILIAGARDPSLTDLAKDLAAALA